VKISPSSILPEGAGGDSCAAFGAVLGLQAEGAKFVVVVRHGFLGTTVFACCASFMCADGDGGQK